MKKLGVLIGLVFSTSVWGSQITVQMLNIPVSFPEPQPNFFIFDINGSIANLLCDEISPNVTTLLYLARVATLQDLTGTALDRLGDPDALKKYEMVAILDLLAYANPALAPDVTWANRFIVDGSGPLTPGAAALLAFVQTQNPANYDLSGFRIYYGIRRDGSFLDTQEQTGFVPEPATLVMVLSSLGGLAFLSRIRRRRAKP